MNSDTLECSAAQLAGARFFLADLTARERGRILWDFECCRALADVRGEPRPAETAAALCCAQYDLPEGMEAGDFIAACHWRDRSLHRLLSPDARRALSAIRRVDGGCISTEAILERALIAFLRAVSPPPPVTEAEDRGAGVPPETSPATA